MLLNLLLFVKHNNYLVLKRLEGSTSS